jgi:hypothetical protein
VSNKTKRIIQTLPMIGTSHVVSYQKKQRRAAMVRLARAFQLKV